MFFLTRVYRKENGSLPMWCRKGRTSLNASLTVEAACIVPIFLYLMIGILGFLNLIGSVEASAQNLHQKAKEAAVIAYAAGELGTEEEMVDLVSFQFAKSKMPLLRFGFVRCVSRACVRAWTGRTIEEAQKDEEDAKIMVYVTETGSVYHKSSDCSYLRLSIRTVSKAAAEKMRSRDGSIYYACSCTKGHGNGSVYITDYGNRYHGSLSCSGLKRTIKRVPFSEVENLPPCSKCGS